MIGHYLLTLTPAQEARVLTQSFERITFTRRDDGRAPPHSCRCLVLTVTDGADYVGSHSEEYRLPMPGYVYEDLAQRFGEERVNAAIRNRILANQARRTLIGVREPSYAP